MNITITDAAGHPIICPLWKLPQLVAADIEKKRAAMQAAKDEEERIAAAAVAEEAARQAEEQRAVDGLNAPFDLSGGGF